MKWYLMRFDKQTERLAGETPIDVTERQVRELFDIADSVTELGAQEVSSDIASKLTELLGVSIDLDDYDVFVEPYADDPPDTTRQPPQR
jgi:hypothetical protein